jgi:hypothetical protein
MPSVARTRAKVLGKTPAGRSRRSPIRIDRVLGVELDAEILRQIGKQIGD